MSKKKINNLESITDVLQKAGISQVDISFIVDQQGLDYLEPLLSGITKAVNWDEIGEDEFEITVLTGVE